VQASGSATVRAYGSATVRASGSATVRASRYVAIQRHGTRAKISGGVFIQIPDIETIVEFCDYYGVTCEDTMVVYKLVDDGFVSAHGTRYQPDDKPEAPDWDGKPACGGGLHFSPRPFMARKYSSGTRFVACEVRCADAVVIDDYGTPDKIKAPRCTVLYECDEDGERIGS
jgi:hypothetical protein